MRRKNLKHQPFLRASTIKFKFPKQLIHTPSGRCPIVLASAEVEDVLSWAKEVSLLGGKRSEYSINAIQYWVRDFYPIRSKEWYAVCNILKENHRDLDLKYLTYETKKDTESE